MVYSGFVFFFFKQKTAYEMRISDWSSDVCSSDLQQIQKYERGTNRIFASRLFHLARVLRVPVAYFFHGLQAGGETKAAQGGAPADAADEGVGDLFGRNDSLKLIQAFNRITDPSVRRQVYALVRTVGEQDSPAERSHHDRVGGRRLPEPAK